DNMDQKFSVNSGEKVAAIYASQGHYLISGIEMERMAFVYLKEGNLANAFVLYNQFIILFVGRFPRLTETERKQTAQMRQQEREWEQFVVFEDQLKKQELAQEQIHKQIHGTALSCFRPHQNNSLLKVSADQRNKRDAINSTTQSPPLNRALNAAQQPALKGCDVQFYHEILATHAAAGRSNAARGTETCGNGHKVNLLLSMWSCRSSLGDQTIATWRKWKNYSMFRVNRMDPDTFDPNCSLVPPWSPEAIDI
ncbi:hypothetical protein EI555_000341, partial [Monodon monoceros]